MSAPFWVGVPVRMLADVETPDGAVIPAGTAGRVVDARRTRGGERHVRVSLPIDVVRKLWVSDCIWVRRDQVEVDHDRLATEQGAAVALQQPPTVDWPPLSEEEEVRLMDFLRRYGMEGGQP